ncbi:MAG: DUF3710 domain-containing protein [Jiangellales bacterium]
MFRRRAKQSETPAQPTADAERHDAGAAESADGGADGAGDEVGTDQVADQGEGDGKDAAGADSDQKPARPNGPWDVSELDGSRPSHTAPRLDLGGLRIRPAGGMQVQMQVDQTSGKATSVLLVAENAALQLMATAAGKSTPLWPTTRRAVQADADRKRGTTQEGNGPWGPVLRLSIPATTSDGKTGVQPSVVLGIDGPRWMLRATMLGRAAVDQEQMNKMMAIVQDTVVVRGDEPMAPGELIELTPPPRPESATDVPPPESATDAPPSEAEDE